MDLDQVEYGSIIDISFRQTFNMTQYSVNCANNLVGDSLLYEINWDYGNDK